MFSDFCGRFGLAAGVRRRAAQHISVGGAGLCWRAFGWSQNKRFLQQKVDEGSCRRFLCRCGDNLLCPSVPVEGDVQIVFLNGGDKCSAVVSTAAGGCAVIDAGADIYGYAVKNSVVPQKTVITKGRHGPRGRLGRAGERRQSGLYLYRRGRRLCIGGEIQRGKDYSAV